MEQSTLFKKQLTGQSPDKASLVISYEITPNRKLNLREVWQRRELIRLFAWRDIKARHKQSILGMGWAIIYPVLMMIAFSLFFGLLVKVEHGDVPYPVFVYTALLPWLLFSEGISRMGTSLISDISLIQKIYYPRLISPLASVITPLFDCGISFLILLGIAAYFGYYPSVNLAGILFLLPLMLLLITGIGLWLAALNAEYRDVRYLIPFLTQLWVYASPVVYPSSMIPAKYLLVYGILSPMAGIIEGFRWAVLGNPFPSILLISTCITTFVFFVSGLWYFHRKEPIFADVL